MKKVWILVLAALLAGCSLRDGEADRIRSLRRRAAEDGCTFVVHLSVEDGSFRDRFSMECSYDRGAMHFTVVQPRELSGIEGSVSAEEGSLDFDGCVLALPMTAGGRISPVSGPWTVMQTLAGGRLVSWTKEGELLHLTMRESYDDDALEAEIWVSGDRVEAAELAWRGRRNLTMEIEDFSFVQNRQEAA